MLLRSVIIDLFLAEIILNKWPETISLCLVAYSILFTVLLRLYISLCTSLSIVNCLSCASISCLCVYRNHHGRVSP